MSNIYILLVGDPGTGKSMIQQKIAKMLKDEKFTIEKESMHPLYAKIVNKYTDHCLKMNSEEILKHFKEQQNP